MKHLRSGIRNRVKALALALATLPASQASAYPIDCAIFLCLAGGWPSSLDCNAARAELIRRITPHPIEPPLQLWRCPMGTASGSTSMSPLQRLEAIKSSSANPLPEFPVNNETAPQVMDVSYSAEFRAALSVANATEWMPLGTGGTSSTTDELDPPVLPEPMLAGLNLSSSDFDVVRSIRVWHVRHYSYRVREREGPCEVRLDMVVGTYDENTDFQWSDYAPGPRPNWLPIRKHCPSSFRGVGVEWTDVFGSSGYELVKY